MIIDAGFTENRKQGFPIRNNLQHIRNILRQDLFLYPANVAFERYPTPAATKITMM
jgi:hypothetical protein